MASKFRRFQPQKVSPDQWETLQFDGTKWVTVQVSGTKGKPLVTGLRAKTKILPKVRETKFTRKKS